MPWQNVTYLSTQTEKKLKYIYSLRFGKVLKKVSPHCPKNEIKTTDIKPICWKRNKDNNTIKYSKKSDKNSNSNK